MEGRRLVGVHCSKDPKICYLADSTMRTDEENSHIVETLRARKPRSQWYCLSARETSTVRRVSHDDILGPRRVKTRRACLSNHLTQREAFTLQESHSLMRAERDSAAPSEEKAKRAPIEQ